MLGPGGMAVGLTSIFGDASVDSERCISRAAFDCLTNNCPQHMCVLQNKLKLKQDNGTALDKVINIPLIIFYDSF